MPILIFIPMQIWRVLLEAVNANFEKFSLLSDQEFFVKGWFRDSMLICRANRLRCSDQTKRPSSFISRLASPASLPLDKA